MNLAETLHARERNKYSHLVSRERNLIPPSYSSVVDKSTEKISSCQATAWLHGDKLNKRVVAIP